MAKAPKPVCTAYGCGWPTNDAVAIELACIAAGGEWEDSRGQKCGLGLPYHVQAFARHVWPWFKWHRWATDLILPELCRPRHRVAMFGASSTGKSCMTAMVYLIFYFARPDKTTVLLSTRTRDELDLRIWGEVKMFWREAKERFDWIPGNLIDSKQMILTDGKDVEGREMRNGVMGRPLKIGNQWVIGTSAGPFVGIKNDYIYLAFDEASLAPEGSLQALANLTANPSCCSAILGNLNDLDTPLGQAAEPELGWDSLPDSDKSRVYDTRWMHGRAIQLIGKDSPQLDYPEGFEPFDPLIGRRYLKQCAEDYGIDTPLYNMFAAGKIPRGTMENRVITKQVCLAHKAFEPVTWGHEKITKLYGMDISYTAGHGDRTVGRPFAFGKDIEGKLRFAPLERPLIYTPSDRASGSIEEQIAAQAMAECKRLEIPPDHLFFDGTGRSSFTAALMRLWSTAVVPIEFGGSATGRPNFIGRKYHEDKSYTMKKGDLLPCDAVFGKMVSELWFAIRYLVEAEQCRALDEETVKELGMRLWKIVGGNRMDVEAKPEMKLRMGRSPDLADAFVSGLEGARRLGFQLGQLDVSSKPKTHWFGRLRRDFDEALQSVELATT